MRFLAAILLCLTASFPALAEGGPDSIYVPGKGYVERWEAPRQAKAAKRKAVTVAGKKFTPTPGIVSFYSDAAPWLADAQRYVGSGNPTSRRSLWCARFVNDRLARAGYRGTGSDAAKSFLQYGVRTTARPGAIAVYHRKGGGHVAVVERVEGNTVTLVSGNCGRAGVCRYTRSVGAAISYRWPGA